MRVSLGPGDVDCRPYYEADPGDWIAKALVAAEDGTFWTHCGVRPLSILRAACQNVFYRRRISGASTITMQAVRLIRPHPKTLLWKWREAVMALKMERAKDKRWILSQYLNRAPYGSNFIGIEAAARGWFGKGAKDLGLGEAAMLAGMVQAPSRFRPDRNLARAVKRRDYVLARMLALGMIDEGQMEAAKSVVPVVCRAPRPFKAPYYCDWFVSELADGGRGASYDITTPLNADIQRVAEHAVQRASAEGGFSVAVTVMRAGTGDVVALACSGDYSDKDGGQVNTALSQRPAGSTLKPLLAALAMDRGVVSPDERLADIPTVCNGYRPANFDSRYRGLVSLRDSLVLSLNIPFVRLLHRIGVREFGDCLHGLGFARAGAPGADLGLGMAIGNVEISLMELVRAYRALACGGGGVFSRGTSYLVSEMLSGDERSGAAFGHVADAALPRFAWKTGTSSAYRDAWTVAWNPEYVIGVWCGHLSGGFGDTSLVGAKAAAPVAWSVARSLYPQNGGPWFERPKEVVRRKVCALTGLPASSICPEAVEGWAVEGRSSERLCRAHRLGLDGSVVVHDEALSAAEPGTGGGLAISSPDNGAVFTLAADASEQKVVCRAVGCAAAAELWWFVDGAPVGSAASDSPIIVEIGPGDHAVTCATSDGEAAEVRVKVEGASPLRLGALTSQAR